MNERLAETAALWDFNSASAVTHPIGQSRKSPRRDDAQTEDSPCEIVWPAVLRW
jgi:hypothetical protein